jgi:hypothetical protein
MLRQLRHHGGDIGRARRIGDQHTRLQVRQLAGHMIEVRSGRDRRAAWGGLLDGFNQVRVAAQDQDGRVMNLIRSGAMRVELQIDLVGRAMCRTGVRSIGHTTPPLGAFMFAG